MESVLANRLEEMFKNKRNVSFGVPEDFPKEQAEQTIIYDWNGGVWDETE